MLTPCHDPTCATTCDRCAAETVRVVDRMFLAMLSPGEPVTWVDPDNARHDVTIHDRERDGLIVRVGEERMVFDLRRGFGPHGHIEMASPMHPVVMARAAERVNREAAAAKSRARREAARKAEATRVQADLAARFPALSAK